MTRMKRNNPHYSIEGGNPLTNPYAGWPEETLTEVEKDAKAVVMARDFIDDWLSRKDRGPRADFEFNEVTGSDSFKNALTYLISVSRDTNLTGQSEQWSIAGRALVKAFQAELVGGMRTNIDLGK